MKMVRSTSIFCCISFAQFAHTIPAIRKHRFSSIAGYKSFHLFLFPIGEKRELDIFYKLVQVKSILISFPVRVLDERALSSRSIDCCRSSIQVLQQSAFLTLLRSCESTDQNWCKLQSNTCLSICASSSRFGNTQQLV